MPAPRPLTQCPAPDLDWSRPEAPASESFGDIYFSVDNGLEESRSVFLGGCNLPEAWQNKSRFVIGELGFGTGLSFIAAWQMWAEDKPTNGHLHFISIEKFPLSRSELAQALASWPDLASHAERLLDLWPSRVKGIHRLHVAPDVTLTLCHMDVKAALAALDARVDAWFLDGFSPAKNPDMWSPGIMQSLASLSSPGARLATFTVAGFVREGLTQAGFTVEKKPGFGRKRHRLEAAFQGTHPAQRTEDIRPLIIGGGIAGAALAKGFSRRGLKPTLIENDQIAASGNPAAIVKPRLDLQDRPESRFFLASYLYALGVYGETSAIETRGVLQLSQSDDDHKRFCKLATNAAMPDAHLRYDETARTAHFSEALVIRPHDVLSPWKSAAHIVKGTAAQIKKTEREWQVCGEDGKTLASGTHIILAAGYGIKALPASGAFNVRYTRGQLTWAKRHPEIEEPVTYGGYALPVDGHLLLGATNTRLVHASGEPFDHLPEDDAENLNRLQEFTGIKGEKAARPSRTAIRVTTNDTLPKFGELDKNYWVLTGLGSRGFVFAPLLAEAIVSKICGDPSPLDKDIGTRFGAREKSNLKTRP